MRWRTAAVGIVIGLLVLGWAGQAMAQATTPIVGTEKLGWDQPAADTAELGLIRWQAYLDGAATAVPILNATCEQVKGSAGFPCRGDIPALTPGDHSIVLTAYFEVGTIKVESPRAEPLPVRMVVAPMAPTLPKIIRGAVTQGG